MMEPIIRFDRKAAVFFGLLFSLFAIATTFKIHGSSIGFWQEFLRPEYRSPNSGVLLGKPQRYRKDEWNIFTPAILSQATVQPSFPISNPRWGEGEVPLVFKFPARHWSMLLRPQFWGFFILDLERAFAFYWDIRAVLLLGGTFVWLMVLTENHFGISLFGAAWLFFSASFLKMAGAKVFNGMNIIPPMRDFRIIDPEGMAKSIYNRYGYMVLSPEQGSDVTFTNVQNDSYVMGIGPNNGLWRKIGIRYIVLPSPSNDPDFIANATLIPSVPGLWIYRYRS